MSDPMKVFTDRLFHTNPETIADTARFLAANGHSEAAMLLAEKLKQHNPGEKYLAGLYGRIAMGSAEKMQEEIQQLVKGRAALQASGAKAP